MTVESGRGRVGTDTIARRYPAHLYTELPNLQLQLPHLGLTFSHHGPQLGYQAAASLGLAVDLVVQVLLRRAS